MSITADALADGRTDRPLEHAAIAVSPPALRVRQVSGAEWDAAIAGFDDVTQEQLYAFAAARWPGLKHEPVLFLDGGDVAGGMLMMIQRLPLGLASIAVNKWGPMRKDARSGDPDGLYVRMIDAVTAEYADRRGMMVSILPRQPLDGRTVEADALRARGYRAGTPLAHPDRYVVNLRLSDADQRKSLGQKWRYHLNKSEKAGLSFEHAGVERLGEFDRLYRAMTDRKKFPDHSAYETVPALMAIAQSDLRPELFFVRHEGEAVAGAIIFKAGDVAVYLYGATNDRALPLQAGYFLHWHIIRWLRDNTKARWYDLGGTEGFQGLHQFKKGMVGDAGVISPIPPTFTYASRPLARALGDTAFGARDLLNRLRRLLDRRSSAAEADKDARAASGKAE